MEQIPRLLAGRYEIGELIGRGGMAEVHVGRDVRLGRTVAIKVLRSDLARDPSFQSRFRREAQASAALNHPSIVAVYDTGEDVVPTENGATVHVPFIVMEYVEGQTVRDILRQGSAVPIDEAIEITTGVLSALEYSHHAGIVHRDIKPANVMITPQGNIKVMDFGIARALADSAATMTQTQSVVGTAQYLSPEQARGEQVDARSDLYSTGCLLFELLTGRPPFVGDSPVAVAYQHVREEAPAPSSLASDVPESLDRITKMALAKDRDERYATASAFRNDLEAALRGGNITAPGMGAAAVGATGATEVISGNGYDQATEAFSAPPAGTTVPQWGSVAAAATPPPSPMAPDDYDDEDTPARRGLMWALIGVGVAAVAAIVLILTLGNGNEPEEPPAPTEVQVPSLTDMNEAGARVAIEERNLKFVRGEDEASDTIPAGIAVSWSPTGLVEEGTEITVRFSSGPGEITVPNVTNDTQADARDRLDQVGLRVGNVSSENHPSIPKGHVIRTEPEAHEKVSPGTSVTLILSDGLVNLEDLTGMSVSDATAILQELKLPSKAEPIETDEQDPDHVVSQSHIGLIAQGTQIVLKYAVAPPPPPQTPEPTQTTPEPTTTTQPPEPTTPSPDPTDTDPGDDDEQ